MVDGFEGEKGAVVAGSRGYFLKVRVRNPWRWDSKEELKKNCAENITYLKRPTNPPLVLAFLLQTDWQSDAVRFLRQENATSNSLEPESPYVILHYGDMCCLDQNSLPLRG